VCGTGALGSYITIELGRSGVGTIMAVDRDNVEVGNLVRQAVNINYLGSPKAEAILHQVHLCNPFTKLEAFQASIGTANFKLDEPDSTMLLQEFIKKYDLIINATADEAAAQFLNEICTREKKPVVHTWITNGAWAGRIVRSVPEKTGCYYCFNLEQPTPASSAPEGPIFPRGCGFPTFTGASYDIIPIAAAATKMAIKTLLDQDTPYDHLLIENEGTLGEIYPRIYTSRISKKPHCRFCGG
jgi:molybdopterin/thiamine biosynthesis adenylyltransferase